MPQLVHAPTAPAPDIRRRRCPHRRNGGDRTRRNLGRVDVESEAARANYVDGMLEIELPIARRNLQTRSVPISRGDDDAGDDA